jgi:hypothetical protein
MAFSKATGIDPLADTVETMAALSNRWDKLVEEHRLRMQGWDTQRADFDRYTQLATSVNGTGFMLDAIGHWMGIYRYPPTPPMPPSLPPSLPPYQPYPPSSPPPPSQPHSFFDFWGASQLAFGTATALVAGTAGPAVGLLTGGGGGGGREESSSDSAGGNLDGGDRRVFQSGSRALAPPTAAPVPPGPLFPDAGGLSSASPDLWLVLPLALVASLTAGLLAWGLLAAKRRRTATRAGPEDGSGAGKAGGENGRRVEML